MKNDKFKLINWKLDHSSYREDYDCYTDEDVNYLYKKFKQRKKEILRLLKELTLELSAYD